MMRDFIRPNGETVVVEFEYRDGSPPTYSPLTGADGGDAPECEITKAYVGDVEIELPDDERETYEELICCDPPEEPLDCDEY